MRNLESYINQFLFPNCSFGWRFFIILLRSYSWTSLVLISWYRLFFFKKEIYWYQVPFFWSVWGFPTIISKCLLLVMVTLVLLSSLKKPIDPLSLDRTVETIIKSFSCPWKESTVLTMIWESQRRESIFFFCDWYGVMTPILQSFFEKYSRTI